LALLVISAHAGPARGQQAKPETRAAAASSSATPARPTVTFAFVRDLPGVPVPRYKVVVRDDGTGSYQGEAIPPPSRYGPAASSAAIPFQRELRVSPATTERILRLAATLNHFNTTCASKAKNIADTGTKTLSYAGADGSGSCTYNYTEVKEVEALTEIFEGITETLDEGRELDRLHRYDRLGLDAAMIYLTQEVAAGRALELGMIETTLHSIAEDADVMARVRARAGALLSQITINAGEAGVVVH
jgi:hypothetical protein